MLITFLAKTWVWFSWNRHKTLFFVEANFVLACMFRNMADIRSMNLTFVLNIQIQKFTRSIEFVKFIHHFRDTLYIHRKAHCPFHTRDWSWFTVVPWTPSRSFLPLHGIPYGTCAASRLCDMPWPIKREIRWGQIRAVGEITVFLYYVLHSLRDIP